MTARIYFDSNTHKDWKYEQLFRFYTYSAILNRALEFLAKPFWTETPIFMYVFDAK